MKKIDINCDMGESFGAYTIGEDEKIIKYITSANIACGWHGGDPQVMDKTVAMCKKHNVSVGAHPSFNDLLGFGRRNMNIDCYELKNYIKYQVGALLAFCISHDVKLNHVKPHGAMYNMAAKDYKMSHAICEALYELDKDLVIYCMPNSQTEKAAADIGINIAREVFIDRAYFDDGSLVPRDMEGAIIKDLDFAISRAIKMIKDNKVLSINGKIIDINVDTICIHGDNKNAVTFAKRLVKSLKDEGIIIKKFI